MEETKHNNTPKENLYDIMTSCQYIMSMPSENGLSNEDAENIEKAAKLLNKVLGNTFQNIGK